MGLYQKKTILLQWSISNLFFIKHFRMLSIHVCKPRNINVKSLPVLGENA